MTVTMRVTEQWHVRFLHVSQHGHVLAELCSAASTVGAATGAQRQAQEGGLLA